MKKNPLILLLFSLILTITINAQEGETQIEIKGGFGIILGKNYPEFSTQKTTRHTIKSIKIPFREYQTYEIGLTYSTKKAYWICATYRGSCAEDAINEFEILKNLLEKKYKTSPRQLRYKDNNNIFMWTNKNRSITITRNIETITIMYRDSKLQEEGRQEKIKEALLKTNSDAL